MSILLMPATQMLAMTEGAGDFLILMQHYH